MKKSVLRQEMQKILKNLDERWMRSASGSLSKELSAFLDKLNQERSSNGLPEISQILAWLSFFPGEADLSNFISEQVPIRSIFLPRSLPGGLMDFWAIGEQWTEQLESGAFGIPEPHSEAGNKYEPDSCGETLVLVPGIAFDKGGNRLGRGKGHYDRFFADPRNQSCVKVGIAWELQIVDKVPSKSHDIPMDYIVHEDGSLRCERDHKNDSFRKSTPKGEM
jgi:5-formyltetrahydrofolate cyclo-ligase